MHEGYVQEDTCTYVWVSKLVLIIAHDSLYEETQIQYRDYLNHIMLEQIACPTPLQFPPACICEL